MAVVIQYLPEADVAIISNRKKITLIEMLETPLGQVRISVKSNCIHTISIGDMPKEMENGMSIEQTQAVLISIEPSSDFVITEIACKLDCSKYKGTASSGQYLDCIEWFGENWHQTLGTEDTEALKLRYPEIELDEVPYPIEYSDDGFTINLNVRKASKTMTLHFLVSSKSLPDERDCTAWFFADRPHKLVQNAIGDNK